MERVKCLLCNRENFDSYIEVNNRFSPIESFNIVKCECSFIFLNPRPDINEISSYYNHLSYTPHKNSDSFLYRIAQFLSFKWKIRIISKYFNKSKKVLDFGSGSGKFTNFIKINGFNAYSLDPFIKSDYSSLEEILVDNKKFDAITMWHSIEHLHDLSSLIIEVKNILKNSGKLFIAIPNHNAIERKYFNEDWIAYDAPRHLYHFNYSTVKLFLEKNNIKVVKVYRMYLDTIYNILYSKSSYNFFYKIFIIIKSIFKIFINKEVSSSILIVCKK